MSIGCCDTSGLLGTSATAVTGAYAAGQGLPAIEQHAVELADAHPGLDARERRAVPVRADAVDLERTAQPVRLDEIARRERDVRPRMARADRADRAAGLARLADDLDHLIEVLRRVAAQRLDPRVLRVVVPSLALLEPQAVATRRRHAATRM